tara:strand:- start:124 stop:585 length:462 start_codon:yes stop_codon:yes gene_type:complete
MENCTIIGYNTWKDFLNDLRNHITKNRGRNSIKEYMVSVNKDIGGTLQYRNSFGSVARMVPVLFKDVQLGSNYIITKDDGQEISGKLMHYQGPNYHLNYDNNAQPGERPYIYVVSFDNRRGNTHHRIFVDENVKFVKIDFDLPEALVEKIKKY